MYRAAREFAVGRAVTRNSEEKGESGEPDLKVVGVGAGDFRTGKWDV